MNVRKLPLLFVLAGAAYAAVIRPRLLRWGATDDEVRRPMSGDVLVQDPVMAATRGISVCARPDEIWLSTRDKEAARRLVIKNGGAPLVRFVQDASGGKGAIVSGASELVNYVNPFTGDSINLRAHADLPNGVMFGRRLRPIPYRNSGIDNPVEMYMQREYFQENFPRTQFQWEVAVKARGVLRGRAMFTVCVAHNIGTTTI